MAEPALLDASPFDLRHYPAHLFDPDLPLATGDLPPGGLADASDGDGDGLDFDIPIDFSIDDFLLRSPEHVCGEGSAAGSGPTATTSSPTSSAANSAVTSREVKHEESEEGRSVTNWGLKRKQQSPGADSEGGQVPAIRRRRGGSPSASRAASEEADERSADGDDEDKRRTARLVRNRESAQLSRQRKKRYVEELEEKVKSMHSVINDLNSKISYFMAENATLRQQIGSGSGNCLPPGVYPPPHGLHFPWVPGYTMRPNGSHVPLVPIPRLKPQQAMPLHKAGKKPECKKPVEGKSKTKTKKVASVSLLGLLLAVLVFGAFVPGFNHSFGMNGRNNAVFMDFGQSHGRVLSVTGHGNGSLNNSDVIGVDCCKAGHDMGVGQKYQPMQNSSETLPALLYVPRNGKHVKINGNLIIHSVLASEKAMAHKASADNGGQSSGKDVKETSLAVARYLSPSGKGMNQQESSPADGPLPQWFHEGMAGPILSSGMCTEAFQFDISAASAHSGGFIPAAPVVNSSAVNATEKLPTAAYHGKLKNRRIMFNEAIPLTGKTTNNTEPLNKTSENGELPDNKPASTVVVSILADPREAGDGDADSRITSKPLSRIFVVVLLDGVKYVTYSCMLPFKGSGPHLVN